MFELRFINLNHLISQQQQQQQKKKKKEERIIERIVVVVSFIYKTRQQTDAQIIYDLYFVFDDFKFAGGFGDIISTTTTTTTTTTHFLYCEKNDDEETNVWEEFDDFRRRCEMEEFLLQ